MEIILDFDGTCVTHEFPHIGKDIGAIPVLKKIVENNHKLILFTMRCDSHRGNYLSDAINWFKENEIELYGIQTNPTQHTWTTSPKALGNLIIDDTGINIPLLYNPNISNRPYVDWNKIEFLLKNYYKII